MLKTLEFYRKSFQCLNVLRSSTFNARSSASRLFVNTLRREVQWTLAIRTSPRDLYFSPCVLFFRPVSPRRSYLPSPLVRFTCEITHMRVTNICGKQPEVIAQMWIDFVVAESGAFSNHSCSMFSAGFRRSLAIRNFRHSYFRLLERIKYEWRG